MIRPELHTAVEEKFRPEQAQEMPPNVVQGKALLSVQTGLQAGFPSCPEQHSTPKVV